MPCYSGHSFLCKKKRTQENYLKNLKYLYNRDILNKTEPAPFVQNVQKGTGTKCSGGKNGNIQQNI